MAAKRSRMGLGRAEAGAASSTRLKLQEGGRGQLARRVARGEGSRASGGAKMVGSRGKLSLFRGLAHGVADARQRRRRTPLLYVPFRCPGFPDSPMIPNVGKI